MNTLQTPPPTWKQKLRTIKRPPARNILASGKYARMRSGQIVKLDK